MNILIKFSTTKMATSIIRMLQRDLNTLRKLSAGINRQQYATFLQRHIMPPDCASIRFGSNTPSGESGSQPSEVLRSGQPLPDRIVQKLNIPQEKASLLLKDDAAILHDIQYETATEIKVKSDAQNNPILLVITATRTEDINEVRNRIENIAKRNEVKKTKRRSLDRGTDNISIIRQNMSLIREEIDKMKRSAEVKSEPRCKIMKFEMESHNPNAYGLLCGKNKRDLKYLNEELQKLNPAFELIVKDETIQLFYPDDIEDDTLKEAACLINKSIDHVKLLTDIFVKDIEDVQSSSGKHQVLHFKAQSSLLRILLLSRKGLFFKRIVQQVQQIDPSLHLKVISKHELPYENIILWSDENIDDQKFEEAVSAIQLKLDWLEKWSTISVKDIKESCKHKVFDFKTKDRRKTFSILIGHMGINLDRIAQHIKKIDHSLHLKILIGSPYRSIVLWSDENIDDGKFTKAATVVRNEIDSIDVMLSEEISSQKSVKMMRFALKSSSPLAVHVFMGKYNENVKKLQENLRWLCPTLRIKVQSAENVFLIYPDDLDESTLKKAATFVDKEIDKVNQHFDLFVSEIQDLQRGKYRVFNFESESKKAWEVLLNNRCSDFKKLIQKVEKIDSSLHLKIFMPEKFDYKHVILWSTAKIDDEKFEEAGLIVEGEMQAIVKSLTI